MQPAQAVLVKQRQRVHEHVIGMPSPGRHRRADRDRHLAVGQRHPLGPAGRARGVGEQRRVVRPGHDPGARPGWFGQFPDVERQQRRGSAGFQPGQPPRGLRIGEGQHRSGVGHQVPELGGGVRGVGQHDHGPGPQRAEVAADESGAGAGREQHPVPGTHPLGQPSGHPARLVVQPGMGDRLPVHGHRDPVRYPAGGRGRQRGDGLVTQRRDMVLHVGHAGQVRPPPGQAPVPVAAHEPGAANGAAAVTIR